MQTSFKKYITYVKQSGSRLYESKDILWGAIYLAGMLLLILWDSVFLNSPAYSKVFKAYFNSIFAGVLVIVFAAALGWGTALGDYYVHKRGNKILITLWDLFINMFKSVPQIIGILVGYIFLAILISHEVITGSFFQLFWMAITISFFVFIEIKELLDERIEYYSRSDFFNAMLCCGITESRIINYEIFWKNSRDHIIQKLISILGITIFLQCSIDFIVSVGLTSGVSLTNFPNTLGNVLAKLDSKQDILAVGNLFSDPFYLPKLFTTHLQGINIAFLITFTLLSLYKISNGYLRRKGL